MAPARPADYRAIWMAKPVLRNVYQGWYRRMAKACRAGRTLEIGGGSGNFKSFAPDVISTDIMTAAWLDAVCDAHRLPFDEASFDNIVMFDVLHHLQRPALFFREAMRVLRADGRIVMLEPAITPVSHVFYDRFHAEPVNMTEDPFADGPLDTGRDPFDSNQAIPTLLFGGMARQAAFEKAFPGLSVDMAEYLALFAYPLTGGFQSWSLLPAWLAGPLTALENILAPVLGRSMAFRMLIVISLKRSYRMPGQESLTVDYQKNRWLRS
ncbi:MAG: class I SAM-dependent methyltransferase [Alphaproteobacteria bacterium]